MIARTWSGRTRREDAETYLEVVRETGLSDIAKTPGNQGAWLLRREVGDEAEFFLISLWDSFESIRAFAGTDVDKARYYPEDDPYLLEKAKSVVHYEVVHRASPDYHARG